MELNAGFDAMHPLLLTSPSEVTATNASKLMKLSLKDCGWAFLSCWWVTDWCIVDVCSFRIRNTYWTVLGISVWELNSVTEDMQELILSIMSKVETLQLVDPQNDFLKKLWCCLFSALPLLLVSCLHDYQQFLTHPYPALALSWCLYRRVRRGRWRPSCRRLPAWRRGRNGGSKLLKESAPRERWALGVKLKKSLLLLQRSSHLLR